jgi:plastocyanin
VDATPTETDVDTQASPTIPPTPAVGVSSVLIENFTYSPQAIQVTVGTTVMWTNLDTTPHTVSLASALADSGNLSQGQTYQYTFGTTGTFRYFCTYHPSMSGVVIVTR